MGQALHRPSRHAQRQRRKARPPGHPMATCKVHGRLLMIDGSSLETSWAALHEAIVTGDLDLGRRVLTPELCVTLNCLGTLTPGRRLGRLDGVAAVRLRTSGLHMAALYRRPQFVQLLLEQGADPTAVDGFGRSPAAVLLEHWPRVNPDSEAGRDLDPSDDLDLASCDLDRRPLGHSAGVLQLMSGLRGACDHENPGVQIPGEDAFSRQVAAWRARSARCLRLLIASGLHLDQVADRRRASTLLHVAARHDLADVIALIMTAPSGGATGCPVTRDRRDEAARHHGNCQPLEADNYRQDGDGLHPHPHCPACSRRPEEGASHDLDPSDLHPHAVSLLPGRVRRAILRHFRSISARSRGRGLVGADGEEGGESVGGAGGPGDRQDPGGQLSPPRAEHGMTSDRSTQTENGMTSDMSTRAENEMTSEMSTRAENEMTSEMSTQSENGMTSEMPSQAEKNGMTSEVPTQTDQAMTSRVGSQRVVDLECRNVSGKTAVLVAGDRGSLRAASLLLALGADVTARDHYGRSLLHLVCSERRAASDPLVREAVRRGAAPGARDGGGNTPLHMAAHLGGARKARCLLQAGASPDVVNTAGRSPLYLGLQRRDPEARHLVLCLLMAGLHLNTAPPRDRPPRAILALKEGQGQGQGQGQEALLLLQRLQASGPSLLRRSVVAVRRAVGWGRLLSPGMAPPALPCPALALSAVLGEDERRLVALLPL